MKRVGAVLLLSAVALVASASIHPFGDPRVEPARGLDTLLRDAKMPAGAKQVLVAKCSNCHSDETRWPVYARLAPGSWLIERDIVKARREMNLSNWEQLPMDTQQVLIAKIVHEAKSGEMPPVQYRALHWGAKLTASEVNALSSMVTTGDSEEGASGTGDAARGRLVFQKRCTGCHSLTENREGPRLAGVFGRRAGSVSDFDYSSGLRNSGITWSEATLKRFLSDPDLVASDTKMDFHVPRAQERADLVAYLAQLEHSSQ